MSSTREERALIRGAIAEAWTLIESMNKWFKDHEIDRILKIDALDIQDLDDIRMKNAFLIYLNDWMPYLQETAEEAKRTGLTHNLKQAIKYVQNKFKRLKLKEDFNPGANKRREHYLSTKIPKEIVQNNINEMLEHPDIVTHLQKQRKAKQGESYKQYEEGLAGLMKLYEDAHPSGSGFKSKRRKRKS
jgi:hypothetical protein